ncbi:MAG: ABC transporter ATP-binding protein [Actinomycetota bacterium]|nr:ABC transporter ATP-binding protein [Actinomycetota bacterium]
MIVAHSLSKWFGPTKAVNGACIEVSSGDTVALYGPNGSGKSTLLKLFAGLLRPTSGRVLIEGEPPRSVRARIGYLGHETYLYPHLTAEENLAFYARLYGIDGNRPRGLLEAVGMAARAGALVHRLSRGEKQRIALARALLHDPDYLLLDEPFTGLDEEISAAVPSIVTREGRTTVIATHDRGRAEGMANRFILAEGGRFS